MHEVRRSRTAMPHLESDPLPDHGMREALIIAFLGGLVTFSAFGAAILAFLTGGNARDNVAQFWVDRATSEIIKRRRAAGDSRAAEGGR
jgi:hypothetical protein